MADRRAQYISSEFRRLGLIAHTQNYLYETKFGVSCYFMTIFCVLRLQPIAGTNAYGVSASPRGSGSEVIMISASWRSCIDDGKESYNLRGIATVLALAEFLRGIVLFNHRLLFPETCGIAYSLWAKNFVFVISDGYLDGMNAFLNSYHQTKQSSK
jgi:GPI-anchor transamidase subunit GAA1